MVHEGDDGVGAEVDRRGGSAFVGEAQVAQLDGGVALRGGRRGKALLLPAARPTLDLNRGGSEMRGREVGGDEETCVVVFVNQLDVVDRPSAFLAVLGEFELNLIGAVCAVSADAVGPSEFAPEEFLAARATERRTRCARRMGGWKGKMEGAKWFGGCPSAVAERRYRKKGTGLVATVPFEKRDGRD